MVPPRAMTSARSVAGRPGPGMHRARSELLEEQGHRLLHGGDGVPGGPVVAVQRPVQQAVPERRGVRVGAQDLLGVVAPRGLATHSRTSSMAAAGQGGGVEVGLQHLRALGGVEPGRASPGPGRPRPGRCRR